MRVRLFSDIGHVMTKLDWEEPSEIKTCMFTVCWGLKYDDVRKGKTCDRGTSRQYKQTENDLFILFCLRK